MQDKINIIMELLGCEYLSESTQKLINITLQKMIESHKMGDEDLYRANESDLLQNLGDIKLDKSILQDLHNKMLLCVETAIKGSSDKEYNSNDNFERTLQTARQLHEMYYPKTENNNTSKINKNTFRFRCCLKIDSP